MKKRILLSLVLIAGIAAAIFFFINKPGNKTDLLSSIPANTLYYAGGPLSSEALRFGIVSTSSVYGPMQQLALEKFIDNLSASDSPQQKFVAYLLKSALQPQNATVLAAMDTLGVSPISEYALYSHGMFPVLKIKVLNDSLVDKFIDQAVAESGWQYRQQQLGGASVRLWDFADITETENNMALALASHNNVLTFTVIDNNDDDKQKRERLGLTKPEQSLADSGETTAISDTYGFANNPIGFIHIERILRAIQEADSSQLGQDLKRYLPKKSRDALENYDQQCLNEFVGLSSAMPRIVGGSSRFEVEDQRLQNSGAIILEAKNPELLTQLGNMQGVLPAYSLQADGELLSYAIGLDMSKVQSALVALQTLFANQSFNCATLLSMQNSLEQANTMATVGLQQLLGVTGIGFSIYDFEPSSNTASPLPESLDALVSISSEDPAVLINKLKALASPMLGVDLDIPIDGSSTDLAIPNINLPLKAAVKNKHLVVFTGETATADANKLADITEERTGLLSMSIDYKRYGKLLSLIPRGSSSQCATSYLMQDMLSRMDMAVNTTTFVDDKGIQTGFDIEQGIVTPPELKLPGVYKTEYLDDSCQWEAGGTETISDNGEGQYIEKDSAGECTLYELNYQWERQGHKLVLNISDEKERANNCADPLTDYSEPKDESCLLINITDQGFSCAFDFGSADMFILRYTRQ